MSAKSNIPSMTTSLADAVAPIEAGAHVICAAFLKDAAALALADGSVVLADPGRETRRLQAHPDGAVLCAATDGRRLMTGGDDGRVVAVDAAGKIETVAMEKGWIDAIAARGDGAICWSRGKNVSARDNAGKVKTLSASSTVRGLAFMAKGYRVAVAHYNGVSLWFPNTAAAPETLAWKGSHLDVTASPDGRFIVTSMQENALHGWRLADGRDMRMSGYPAKTRSFSWSSDGGWLATSGADACVIWPFQTKDGPMGRAPKEVGVRSRRVSCVACHPGSPVVALGYLDGFIMLARIEDGAEILVRSPGEADGAVSALVWDPRGERLLFGTEGGVAGIVTLPA